MAEIATSFLTPARYNRLLLLVAGLGGLLYGVDVGIIGGALPYLEATSGLNAGQISLVVAAVLLGTVFSTLFAGLLADAMGRQKLMVASGALFVISIPIIALSHGYGSLILGRLCQGISAGIIGVVVPLYLAECLPPEQRGRGTALFQWLLTLGIVVAALVGMYFSLRVEAVARLHNPQLLFAFKDAAWRGIFWVSLPPGVLFMLGGLLVAESPRWLVRRKRTEAARQALARSRQALAVESELAEIEHIAAAEAGEARGATRDPLWKRRYVLPFLLACAILAANQATGINSIIFYNASILIESGLSDVQAHWGYILFTLVNALLTVVGVVLVDRKGRKFLLTVGTAGIVTFLSLAGILFWRQERQRVDVPAAAQALIQSRKPGPQQAGPQLRFTPQLSRQWLQQAGAGIRAARPTALSLIYSYGNFRCAAPVVRSNHPATLKLNRSGCLPANRVIAFFNGQMGNLAQARKAPLRIRHALLTPLPGRKHGWIMALCLFCFVGFFAMGPGICVWLALSELMPTRIRSNGMSIALLLNEAVGTFISAIFLPAVGRYGYAPMFFIFAGCTVGYFLIVVFLLPETKGKTLEEIEGIFAGKSHEKMEVRPG